MSKMLTLMQKKILSTLAYFDIFSYPLTLNQIFSFLPADNITIDQLQAQLDELIRIHSASFQNGYYFLGDRHSDMVSQRINNEQRASRLMTVARMITFFLKRVPFIRAVFITGSLSKHVAHGASDIDFMIVTEPNRLWVCKMILTGIRRTLLLNSKKYFCINLMLTENAFRFTEHNIFNAVEIVTTKALWNDTMLRKFRNENSWIGNIFPNSEHHYPFTPLPPGRQSIIQRWMEIVLNCFRLDEIDAYYRNTAYRYWKKKHADIDDTSFDARFQCQPDISSVWFNDHRTAILNKYQRNLELLGIDSMYD